MSLDGKIRSIKPTSKFDTTDLSTEAATEENHSTSKQFPPLNIDYPVFINSIN